MFKLNIESGDKKIIFKQLSISLRYLVDEKKLQQSFNSLEKVFDVRFSELQRKNFLSKEGKEIRVSKNEGKPDAVIIHKVILDAKFNVDYFRNHLSKFIQNLEDEQVQNVHVFIPNYSTFKKYFINEEYYYQSFIEGLFLGNYTFDKYLSEQKQKRQLNIFFYAEDSKKLKSAIQIAKNINTGLSFTRDLQNEPSINLTPELLAIRIKEEMAKLKIKTRVFDQKEIAQKNMGGLLAVGMGSSNPPRFIQINYKSSKSSKKKLPTICLVGKGVTFDSGGISIKPAANMGDMKADMSGAAVVAGTIIAAAKNKIPLNIIGIIPSAENMISGSSLRPGDIIKTSSGKTIEVDNTDAEGRVILADALDFASKLKPDIIIDLATLTGACVVALGEFVGGLFSTNDELSNSLYDAGQRTFDRIWRLPLWDDYNILNKSDVADIKNLGGRWGGAITAAKFLENFIKPELKWAHLDIAGPAFPNSSTNYTKKYMTGFGVRLLSDYLSNYKSK